MSTVISLSDYRARHDRAPQDAPPGTDRLARAQESLAQASQALHGLTACLDEVARRLGRPDEAMRERGLGQGLLDRKSTRLNSSHQIISYAVFCLKKKKR